ncbi:MAG: TlpA disulfide reductase family protein [Mariprofundaceae bacterium]|nr:TlpA disulfide reductase family protein [Mariprofundaceae bacterium]
MRARFFLLLGTIMLVWVVSAQADTPAQEMDAFGVQVPRIHKSAPDFSLVMLGGEEKALADYRGKVVLLHFWATWCVACRHEMPQIEQLWRRYRDDGLVVLGVNVDRGNISGVRDFMHERKLSFPSVLDPGGGVRNRYEVRALPTSYLINRDGKIIGRIIGERDWSSPASHAMLTAILKQGETL